MLSNPEHEENVLLCSTDDLPDIDSRPSTSQDAQQPKRSVTQPAASSKNVNLTKKKVVHLSADLSARELIRAAFEKSENVHMDFVDELMTRGEEEISAFFLSLSKGISQRNMGIEPCSIEAVLHKRGRSATPGNRKRKAISMESAVLTDEAYLKKCREAAKPKPKTPTDKSKPKKAVKRKAIAQPKRKLPVTEDSDTTSISSFQQTDCNTSSDLSLRDFESDSGETLEEGIEEQHKEIKRGKKMKVDENVGFREVLQRELGKNTVKEKDLAREADKETRPAGTTVNIDDADISKYVAVAYTHPKFKYYWGKITKVFSQDSDATNDKVEIDFLRKRTMGANPADWDWEEKQGKLKEIEIIDTKHILYGPILPTFKGRTMKFPDFQAMAALQELEGRLK